MVSSLKLVISQGASDFGLRVVPVYLLRGCSDAITRHRRLLSLFVPEETHITNTHFLSPTISCRNSFHLLIVWAHLQGRACPSDSTKCQVFRSQERPVVYMMIALDCTEHAGFHYCRPATVPGTPGALQRGKQERLSKGRKGTEMHMADT